MTIIGVVKGDMVCTWDTNTFPFLPNQVCHCVAILYLLRTFGVAALSLMGMEIIPWHSEKNTSLISINSP